MVAARSGEHELRAPPDGSGECLVRGGVARVQCEHHLGNGVELGAAVRYARLGDATTRTIAAEFEDNDALSLILRVGYRF